MASQFEAKLQSLDDIVHSLEKGDLSLEAALAQFEQGVKVVKQCQKTLTSAEQRIQQLIEKDGKIEAQDFNSDLDEEPK